MPEISALVEEVEKSSDVNSKTDPGRHLLGLRNTFSMTTHTML